MGLKQIGAMLLVAWSVLFNEAGAADKPVQIGFAGPLTGLSGASGVAMLKGAELAIEDINKQGIQIGGDRLVFSLLTQNDKSSPWIGVNAAGYFVKTGVVGVVGLFNSGVAIATSDVYSKADIAHFAVSGSRRFTQQGHRSAFRITPYDDQRAASLAEYAVKDMQWRRIAIVHDDSAFGKNYKDKFSKAALANGASILSTQEVGSSTFDFNQVLVRLKREEPQAIFLGALGEQTIAFARGIKRFGINAAVITAASVVDNSFIEAVGASRQPVVSIKPGAGIRNIKKQEVFERRYREKFSATPGGYSMFVYDEVQVLAAAIKQANSVEPKKITEALHSVTHVGLTGDIAFDAQGDLREPSFDLYQAKDGAWTIMKQIRLSGGR